MFSFIVLIKQLFSVLQFARTGKYITDKYFTSERCLLMTESTVSRPLALCIHIMVRCGKSMCLRGRGQSVKSKARQWFPIERPNFRVLWAGLPIRLEAAGLYQVRRPPAVQTYTPSGCVRCVCYSATAFRWIVQWFVGMTQPLIKHDFCRVSVYVSGRLAGWLQWSMRTNSRLHNDRALVSLTVALSKLWGSE